jgi:hydroxypyruvate isomerase
MDKSIDRLSVCIETIFPYTVPYEEQIRTCAELGFSAYEFWYHDMVRDGKGGWVEKGNAKDLDVVQRMNQELGLKLVTFALNSPHIDHGGTLVDERGTEMMFRELDRLLPIVQKIGVLQLITYVGDELPDEKRSTLLKRVVTSLRKMDRMLEGTGVMLTVEPLSHPKYEGCLLPTVKDAGELLREVGGKNVKMLYDVFHVQTMTGNILASLQEYIEYIGHIHISGIPGQHEPVEGELNLPLILGKLAEMGYAGYYGLEYYPLKEPVPSLRETIAYLQGVGSFS